uniref:Vitelline membrane outer layer 1 homolog b n=1 Tax=Astyanax mexicanus TaxID=7994 RepID=A0A8B9GTP5_ASTMX
MPRKYFWTIRLLYARSLQIITPALNWGTWTNIKWCWSGLMKNFQLRVEPPQGNGDDTAVNNVRRCMLSRFQCTAGGEITGEGTSWGDWGGWSKWCSATGICGIQTKIEGSQGSGDDTSLNDVRFFCCD